MIINVSKNKTIRIVTYNLFLFSNPHIITQNILTMKKQGVNIFCLQEILKTKGKLFVGDVIMKALGDEWDIAYSLGNESADTTHGVAILWNKRHVHKIDVTKIVLPKVTNFSFFHKLMRLGAGFKNIVAENKALSITFSVYGRKVRITSAHISLNGGVTHHLEQHLFIKSLLVDKPVPHEIIAGDFNTLRGFTYKREMQQIQNIYGGEFTELSSDIPWTQDLHYSKFEKKLLNTIIIYTKLHYRQKLDHIFVKGFIPVSCKRLPFEGSDHFPISTELIFK